MAEHKIQLEWTKGDVAFTYDAYSRNHQITFKDGVAKTFSAASVYRGDPTKGDPEDMFVAALSSCHMLSFLAIAARKRITVLAYDDDASGWLENEGGKLWMTRVVLRPKIQFEGAPDAATVDQMHHMAHEQCFIANSVKTDVRVEPR
ncbi:MAG: OsmC family protein [Proteobacteria bacterium]|nr:OsmC family protein [Pseudomonadota bacterium]